MICPNCKTPNDEGATYCSSCAERLPARIEVQAAEVRVGPTMARARDLDEGHWSSLAVVAFVLAFLVPPLGVLLGVVSCIVIGVSKKRIRGLGMGIAAIPIGMLFTGFLSSLLMPVILTATREAPAIDSASVARARMQACTVRQAIQKYQAQYPGQCPTLRDLEDNYYLPSGNRLDPWGREFIIECTGPTPQARSRGASGFDRITCE